MFLSSVKLSKEDNIYLNDHFSVVKKNVSSFDEAEVFLLGDSHTNRIHHQKICWLINKLAKTNDIVLAEGFDSSESLTNRQFEKMYHYPLFSKVKILGWDSKEALDYDEFHESRSDDFIKRIDKTVLDLNILEDEIKLKSIKKLHQFHYQIIQELNDFIEHKNHLDAGTSHLPRLFKKLEVFCAIAEKAKSEKLSLIFLYAAKTFCSINDMVKLFRLKGNAWAVRQKRFSLKITNERKEGQKIYGIAGRAHLENRSILCEKALKKFYKKLNKQSIKYVALEPTYCSKNLEYISNSRTLWQKISGISFKNFQQSFNYKHGLSLTGAAAFFTVCAEQYSFISPSTSLFMLATVVTGSAGVALFNRFRSPIVVSKTKNYFDIVAKRERRCIDLKNYIKFKIECFPATLAMEIYSDIDRINQMASQS